MSLNLKYLVVLRIFITVSSSFVFDYLTNMFIYKNKTKRYFLVIFLV